jgi:hypothetical protein
LNWQLRYWNLPTTARKEWFQNRSTSDRVTPLCRAIGAGQSKCYRTEQPAVVRLARIGTAGSNSSPSASQSLYSRRLRGTAKNHGEQARFSAMKRTQRTARFRDSICFSGDSLSLAVGWSRLPHDLQLRFSIATLDWPAIIRLWVRPQQFGRIHRRLRRRRRWHGE